MSHYHVSNGTPGYLRDNSQMYTTKAAALDAMRWDRNDIDDAESETDSADRRKRTGSLKAGYFHWESTDPSSYDLGYVLSMDECDEPDCSTDDNDW